MFFSLVGTATLPVLKLDLLPRPALKLIFNVPYIFTRTYLNILFFFYHFAFVLIDLNYHYKIRRFKIFQTAGV